jgi:hypothetical protein
MVMHSYDPNYVGSVGWRFYSKVSLGINTIPNPHQKPVAHTCKLSYSGGRDQEDHSSKTAPANSFQHPISKPFKKKGTVDWFKEKA